MDEYPYIVLAGNQTLLSEEHADYYTRTRGLAVVIGLIPLLFSAWSMTKTATLSRMDGRIAAMLVFASFLQCVRGYDPMGMGDNIGYKVNLALLWIITSLAANAQVGSLSGYLTVLDILTPSKVAFHAKVFRISRIVLLVKLIGDVLVIALMFLVPEYLYITLLIGYVLGMGVYVIHPCACYYFSKKLADASKNVFSPSAGMKSKKADAKRLAYTRLGGFSLNVRLLAALNIIAFTVLVGVALGGSVHFEGDADGLEDDPFDSWKTLFFLVDIVLPLLQMAMLFCCLKVFAKAAEVVEDKAFKAVAFGLIALVAIIVACSGDDDFDEDG